MPEGSYLPSKQMRRMSSNHAEGKNPAEGTHGDLHMSTSGPEKKAGKNPDHPSLKHGGVGQDDVVRPSGKAKGGFKNSY